MDAFEARAREDRPEHDLHLEHREVVADAGPRAAAERKVGEAREPLREAVPPALGPELVGLREPALVVVHYPLGEPDLAAPGNAKAAELEVFERLASDRP